MAKLIREEKKRISTTFNLHKQIVDSCEKETDKYKYSIGFLDGLRSVASILGHTITDDGSVIDVDLSDGYEMTDAELNEIYEAVHKNKSRNGLNRDEVRDMISIARECDIYPDLSVRQSSLEKIPNDIIIPSFADKPQKLKSVLVAYLDLYNYHNEAKLVEYNMTEMLDEYYFKNV